MMHNEFKPGEKIEYKFDCQMLIARVDKDLDEDEIFGYISENLEGDSLLAVGDEDLIKIHFHSNKPWEVLEYAASLGDIHDIVFENMQRQADGLQG